MQPARLDLPVIQGATFRQILRIMQPELAYRPITAIASTSPVRLSVDHDLPTDWPVWVRGVQGMPDLNREVTRQRPHLARVVDAQHLDINLLAATGLLPKGGELSYYLPVDLAGATATLKVLDAAGAELLSLVPTVHAGGWVEILLTDEETAALAWKEGAWFLDLAFPNGESYRAATGKATVYPAGTVPSGNCDSAWVLTAGAQGVPGVPGPIGPAFKVDASGPLADRGLYDAEGEGFSFLATDTGDLYLREGAAGGWSAGVPFQGPEGVPGDDGRSIISVAINGAGHLIITYSDGTTSDAGAMPTAPTVWGTIGGTLLDQDDLALALSGKATAAQGAKADSAVQPADLAPVATSGSYADLSGKPFIPSTPGDVGAATAAQGAKADTAVQPATLTAGLAGKVDKEAGKGLSQENFTSAEKAKLASLESTHFKGAFASLAALQAALPTAVAGDYADVDAGVGSDTVRYIWDVSDSAWVPSGSGSPLTAAQIKTLYESNPDTNPFTDAEEAKLAGIATEATKNSNTDELAEGATNQYFTAARVRAVVLTGLSLATSAAIAATDTVLGALGKLQAQITAHFGSGGSAHADATTSASGFMSASDKTKLNGIAANATANDTDANLKNRTNHTGTQSASTISDFSEAVDDRVAALLVQGSNITLTYDDAAGTLTIAAAGGGSGGDLLATLVNAEVAISAATTLTSGAFGKMHTVTGTTADYAVGLPAVSGNGGKLIGLRMSSALTKFITVDGNASELIDGALTRVMWKHEVAILYCDGTAWIKLGGKTVPMVAEATRSTGDTTGIGVTKLIDLDTASNDPAGLVDLSGDRINIKRTGSYLTTFQCVFPSGGTASTRQARLDRNGANINSCGPDSGGRTARGSLPVTHTAGDYIQLSAFQNNGTESVASNILSIVEVPTW
ncbi:hypothetical protein [Pseudomonas sp. LFM046]|uniref:hypothetical protein n=1 Tax=Pseudomonas sp. LFM046 TaxID=1608357 RepID=UPI0006969F0F|nr:hypothetical protein [Pseudomonas sp. LFM046]